MANQFPILISSSADIYPITSAIQWNPSKADTIWEKIVSIMIFYIIAIREINADAVRIY